MSALGHKRTHDLASAQCLAHRSALALSVRLDVASEVIENRLPALALLLDRMGRFAVECNAHFDTGLIWGELDLGLTITKGILDQLRLDDLRVRSSEIEAHAAVLSLHA
jgi:hypothetical protein